MGILGVIPRCKHLHPFDSSPSVRRFSTLSWDVAGERSGPEATAGCPETPWITVSSGGVGGGHVHHRADLRTEGEAAKEGKTLVEGKRAETEGG